MESNYLESCDESKCVSTGRADLHNLSFTCYGDDSIFFPRMCADGYLPVVVEDEPTYFASRVFWNLHNGGKAYFDSSREVPVRYFTCCPPDGNGSLPELTSNVTRHCSDPIAIDSKPIDDQKDTLEKVCEDRDTQRFPIQMKTRTIARQFGRIVVAGERVDSVVCCDSKSANTTKNFLEEIHCVPYMNAYYSTSYIVPNSGDVIFSIGCDDSNGDFLFSRPLENKDVVAEGYYQCCKTGPPLPPYLQDMTFRINIYTRLTLESIATIVSTILIIGLLIPLLSQMKRGTLTDIPSRRRRRGESSYSTYNLYLIYLAIPDLLRSLVMIHVGVSAIMQKQVESIIVYEATSNFSLATNLGINAIMLHQMLILLRNLQSAQRIDPPSLRMVSLQAGTIYLMSAIFAALYLTGNTYLWNGKFGLGVSLIAVAFLLFIFPPIGYGIYASILVCRNDYLPARDGTQRDNAIRELAIFFFRIVAVFVVIWAPVAALFGITIILGRSWASALLYAAFPIQTIATFITILSKSDIRKHILDLVTLSYLFENCGSNQDQKLSKPNGSPEPGTSSNHNIEL